MSSFDLLDEEDLIYQIPKKQHKKKKVPIIRKETEFTKIHLNEVWVVILAYFDVKTLYLKYVTIDHKVKNILYEIHFQKYILNREFRTIISGEEEQDHLVLLNSRNMTLEERIAKTFAINDPLNIFGFRTDFYSKPTSDHPYKVFENLFIGLLNRRTNIVNRNMKLRQLIPRNYSLGGRCENDYYSFKRQKNTKVISAASDDGLALMDNDSIEKIDKEARKIFECEHFNIHVSKCVDMTHPFVLSCKSCNSQIPVQADIWKKIEKYL